MASQLTRDYLTTFMSPNGQRVLKDLRKKCPQLVESFSTSGGIDTNKMLFREGQRSVLLYIFKRMRKDPFEEEAKESRNARK